MSQSVRQLLRTAIEQRIPRFCRRTWSSAVTAADLAARELRGWRYFRVPIWARAKLWKRGFLTDSYVLYGAPSPSALGSYLSDFGWYFRTGQINGDFAVVLDSKVLFFLVLRSYTERVVPVLGVIDNSRFVPLEAGANLPYSAALDALATLGQPLFIKPVDSSGGWGAFTYEFKCDMHHINNAAVDVQDISQRLKAEAYVVSPVVRQASYSEGVFSGCANTIRIMTMWDYDHGEAFVARAVHRFGSSSSGVVDNWSSSGLCAGIDVATGIIGPAVAAGAKKGHLVWHREHPDTRTKIEGLRIPNWELVREEITALANNLPFLPYVGWDIVVQDAGFSILEGNNRPGVAIIQIHGPLLKDERVREFYSRHGAV